MRHAFRFLTTLLLIFSVSLPASPVNTPLSDEAVRDAYFIGQRHDGTYPGILSNYIKNLPRPKFGPHISSITLKTPFIQLVEYSDHFIGNYNAQQALLDHRDQQEFILIFIAIQLTDTYGRLMPPPPNWRSRSNAALVPRPEDFWRDFRVHIRDGKKLLTPYDFHGHANFDWAPDDALFMTGATLEFDFPAESFPADSVSIDVIPPEGDPVSVDFDLTRIR